MRLTIIFFLLIGQLAVYGHSIAQTAKKKKTAKEEMLFTLKEPKLEKKSSTDWIKTTGLAAGTIMIGGGIYWFVSQPKEEEKSEGLPKPPDWPSR
ncbi:MAG: hypothetical protein JSW07_12725 [bacterium]|nr:MAG: hypothetical protein JSW07_12725 [bacterium]